MYQSEYQRVAENILSDRNAADYYRDPKLLTNYLAASFDAPKDYAMQVAKRILDDRHSANFYCDSSSMTNFLEERFDSILEREDG